MFLSSVKVLFLTCRRLLECSSHHPDRGENGPMNGGASVNGNGAIHANGREKIGGEKNRTAAQEGEKSFLTERKENIL